MSTPTFRFRDLGPGLVIAATGLGAGDLIAASVAGAKYGTAILWAALLGALMKYAMTEGLARWQLATGSTLLEGWIQRLPRAVSVYFLIYLLLWSFVVAGALIASTGLAAHALFPSLPIEAWGMIQSVIAALLVLYGRYRLLEQVMKLFIAAMFLLVMVCALLVAPPPAVILDGLLDPALPPGSVLFALGVIGGVGGSVTLLCYGYWIREHGWKQPSELPLARIDLRVAYTLTGLFGIAVMIIAAGIDVDVMSGSAMILGIAARLETVIGPVGKWCFLAGFWSAVFSSMLGVWQGIPYLFADFAGQWRSAGSGAASVDTRSPVYRGYLLYLALPPMLLLLAGKPVWLVVLYAVAGAFFMPLLAGLLLYMNNRRDWLGSLRNGVISNLLLAAGLLVFGILLLKEVSQYF